MAEIDGKFEIEPEGIDIKETADRLDAGSEAFDLKEIEDLAGADKSAILDLKIVANELNLSEEDLETINQVLEKGIELPQSGATITGKVFESGASQEGDGGAIKSASTKCSDCSGSCRGSCSGSSMCYSTK